MRYLLALLLMACALTAQTTRYVSTTGNNSHTKVQAQNIATPWRTIKHGLQQMSGGDTLILRGGTYTETRVYEEGTTQTLWKDGTEANPTTIKNYPGETPIVAITQATPAQTFGFAYPRKWITLDGLTFSGANAVDKSTGVRVNMHNGVITNCSFINWNDAVALQPAGIPSTTTTNNFAHHVQVSSCLFSNITTASVALYPFSGYDYTIEDNIFTHTNDRGIEFGSSAAGTEVHGMVIRRNFFLPGGGLYLSAAIYDQIPSNSGVEIYNNVIVDCSGVRMSINAVRAALSTAAPGSLVANNTLVQTIPQTRDWIGIYVRQTSARLINNIAWGTFKYPLYVRDGRTAYITNTISGPANNLTAGATILASGNWSGAVYDPQFIDPPTDVRIGVTSQAVGTGLDLSSVFAGDAYGDTRTVPWDIGAIKAGSDGGGEDPSPPTVVLPLISVSATGPAYETSAGTGTFTITRAGSLSGTLDIVFAMSGTAVSNVNYTLSGSSPVTIADAADTATITLTPENEGTIGIVTATLTVQADAAYTLSSVPAATLEIVGSGTAPTGFRPPTGSAAAGRRR